MSSRVHIAGGQPITFSFGGDGSVAVNLPTGKLPVTPSEPPAPAPPAPVEEKPENKDHSFDNPRDMSELVPSDKQSWNSGGTAHLLPMERKKASFKVGDMTESIYGGKENVDKRKFVLAPSKKWSLRPLEKYNMSREELMAAHFRDFIGIHKSFTGKGYRPSPEETAWMSASSINSGALTTHMGLFLPTLVAQTNTAQQLQWLPRVMKFQIVGAYAQTELGHGSNVRGLQTTATYDVDTEEFILDTPTLQSMKFWNSGAGLASTHATVYAQLLIKGKCYGVHVFFVQLRDEFHKTLPNIEIGDCGNKLGDNGIDCGYIRFKQLRIPREHMLARKSQVLKDGTYVKNKVKEGEDPKAAERLQYMTMLTARANMIGISAGKLAMACTTAVRYSCVRQQGFAITDSAQTYESPEKQIIDYQMQHYRLMKNTALSYAIQFSSRWMMMRFTQLSKGLWKVGFDEPEEKKEGETEDEGTDLPEIHASAAGLKGLCCRLAADGMEDCRKCCGGHGYVLASGIAGTWSDYVWQATAEGDLVVMMLQTARFLVKSLGAARKGETLSGMMEYLRPFGNPSFNPLNSAPAKATNAPQFRNLANLQELLKQRAMVSLFRADRILADHVSRGSTPDQAWQASSLSLVQAAERHCYYFMFAKFLETVNMTEKADVKRVLSSVCAMYGLTQIVEGNGWGGIIDGRDAELAETCITEVLNELRPEAVTLVDAFDIPDRVLNSALGRYDGNVYEELYKHARDTPLNETGPFAGYYEFVRPHLDLKFLELRGDAPKGLKKSMAPRGKKSRAKL
eukprot:TRINITY_DN19845_c0_g1_i1.p1 TRINITY_DN19845_c0_g1~~TRINITY_DN19845_c0_g1_i1.p1  ORF type:complete len:795 (+),score=371.98 TRINITY_DN19845_c0_g1_i1:51-2435(+)